ncbi:MAG TPA: sigma-70 family RNA polymerase sigma factor [Azospirillaceae bacterium]|nr:sigma-70 family RNA polymerase sigma factor [Azospirillaceae bacterium]
MTYSFTKELVTCIPSLTRYACKLTRDAAAAEDLVQDCLARALSRQHRFEPGTNMQAWLTTMLKNLHFNNLQREKHMTKVELWDSAASVEASQMSRLMFRDVDRAFRRLTVSQRKVVKLVAIEGRPYQEAADTLNVSIGTIRSRLCRARERLNNLVAA